MCREYSTKGLPDYIIPVRTGMGGQADTPMSDEKHINKHYIIPTFHYSSEGIPLAEVTKMI